MRKLITLILVILLVSLSGCSPNDRNYDGWGLDKPAFSKLEIDPEQVHIRTQKGLAWVISYESQTDRSFTGIVRHVSHFTDGKFPFLTHDILVTSGDFSDPEAVRTRVMNHHYYWTAKSTPSGSINLLHTVILDEEVYDRLMQIRANDQVTITGREIGSIEYYLDNGRLRSTWSDSGCNTLVVKDVTLVENDGN